MAGAAPAFAATAHVMPPMPRLDDGMTRPVARAPAKATPR
jgi:hypothetical protein